MAIGGGSDYRLCGSDFAIYRKKIRKKIKEILKQFDLIKIENTNPNELTEANKIKVQLAKCLLQSPKILLLDDIFITMNNDERNNIIRSLKDFQIKMDLTIIMTTSNLNDCLLADYIYVIEKNTIALEGTPIEVLQKDNVLNRIGLELPFIIDLSVKLRDYDLINDVDINSDIDGMVNLLWK